MSEPTEQQYIEAAAEEMCAALIRDEAEYDSRGSIKLGSWTISMDKRRQAAAMIKRLAAAPRHAEGWQPISSAPKDGTSIQIKGRQGPYGVLAWEGCAQWGRPVNWHKDDSTWLEPGTGAVLALAGYRPTHWQPLPEPKRSDDGETPDQETK